MAASTVVRDSIVGDAWIQQTAAAVPIQPCYDASGQPTGDFLTGPVRLAFESLFRLPAANANNQNPKFGASLLFTPYADFKPLYDEYYRVAAAKFADKYDAQSGQYYGIRSPFRNQGEKLKFGGFTPGLTFMICTSKFKPPVVDARYNPIVDESKVYPGVWAICAINCYSYHDPKNPGIAFGLQSVMIVGDDTSLGGGAADPHQTFNRVKGVAAPIVRPDNIARSMPSGGMGQPPVPTGAPGVPQQTWSPPVPGMPAPPMQSGDDDMSFLK